MLILGSYHQSVLDEIEINFRDVDINEDNLLKQIKEIKGDADFSNSDVTSLDNLQYIGGEVGKIYVNHLSEDVRNEFKSIEEKSRKITGNSII